MFKYGDHDVLHFLLSNLNWWMVEYQIDGFYFHSLGSMMYTHNGFATFTDEANSHKRKVRDVEESECRSDATELDSASGNKQSQKFGTTRQSRVAEIHNLSG